MASFWIEDLSRTITRDGAGKPKEIPTISTGLDSIRTYGFTVEFSLPTNVVRGSNGSPYSPAEIGKTFQLAAKQVSNTGYTNEDIEVHRFNDRVYYPGKPSLEEVTITFDNLLADEAGPALFDWFRTIYDPLTGKGRRASKGSVAAPSLGALPALPGAASQRKIPNYKQLISIVNLAPDGKEMARTNLIQAYPKSWKTAEFNYSNNDFHTIEVSFRYDYIDHVSLTTL